MRVLRLFGGALLLAALAGARAGAENPRVVVLHGTFDNARHSGDYDGVLKQLGWSMEKIPCTDLDRLAAAAGECDIILASALFRYQSKSDFAARREMWLQFLNRGGALVLTDCNYREHLDWLASLGPAFAASLGCAGGSQTPATWVDEKHPLLNTPNRLVKWGDFWASMKLPETYQVLVRAGDETRLAVRPVGRGVLVLSSYWGFRREMLENLWEYTRCQRAGVIPALPNTEDLFVGDHRLTIPVTNTGEGERVLGAALTLAEPDGHTRRAMGETVAIPPGETRDLPLAFSMAARGAYRLTFSLFDDGGKTVYTAATRLLDIPPLLAVRAASPAYRNSIFLAAPPEEVRLDVTLTPHREKPERLHLTAALRQGGKYLARLPDQVAKAGTQQVVLPLKHLGAGRIEADVALMEGKRVLDRVGLSLSVVPPADPQVFVDAEGVTRVGREPFFPVGIYHIPVEKLSRAKTMGFNTVVGWGNNEEGARHFLDAARQSGLKVILELSRFLRGSYKPEELRAMVRALKTHPALLAWYTVDEPSGEQLEWCRQAREMIAVEDPHHPVYLVMCSPGDFERFGRTTDILAVDPYPIPGSVNLVASWMRRAVDAVQGTKPVWVIPQLHNSAAYKDPKAGRGPTPAEERNMVYQGLIYGAQGVVYYPWDDGPCGLVHDPALMDAVARVNGELARLAPALMKARRRLVTTEAGEARVHAALFEAETDSLLLVANGETKETSVSLALPEVRRLEGIFGEPGESLQAGKASLRLKPLEVRAYRVP